MNYRVLLHDRLLKVVWERPGTAIAPKNKPAKRGQIEGLSKSSLVRLIRFMACIRRPGPVYFVTLTYLDWVEDFDVWKGHLNRFLTALRKAYPTCGVWRLEFQKRGAPHFHLLLWIDGTDEAELLAWMTDRWLAAIAQRTKALEQNAVKVSTVFDLFRSEFYLSLHHSKKNQDRTDIKTGRLWGKINGHLLDANPHREDILTPYEGVLLRRVLRRVFVSRRRSDFRASRYYQSLGKDDRCFSSLMEFGGQEKLISWIHAESAARLDDWPEPPANNRQKLSLRA